MANEVKQDVNVQVHTSGINDLKDLSKLLSQIMQDFSNISKISLSKNSDTIINYTKNIEKAKNSVNDLYSVGEITAKQLYEFNNALKNYTAATYFSNLAKAEEEQKVQLTQIISLYESLTKEITRFQTSGRGIDTTYIDDISNKGFKLYEIINKLDLSKLTGNQKQELLGIKDGLQDIYDYLSKIVDKYEKQKDILSKIESGGGMKLLSDSFKSDRNETSDEWLKRIQKFADDLPDNSKQIIDNDALKETKEIVDEIEKTYKEIVKPDFAGSFLESADSEKFWNFAGGFNQLDEVNKKTVDLTKVFELLGRQFGLSSSQSAQLAKAFGATAVEAGVVGAAIAVIIKTFKEFYDVTSQILGTLKDMGVSLAKFTGNLAVGSLDAFIAGLNMITDAFSQLVDFSKEAIDQLQEFADIGGDIQDSYFKIYQYLGEKAGADIIDYTNKLGTLLNIDTSKLLKGMKGILAVTSQLGLDADGVTKYTKALNNFALDLSAFSGESIENITNQFENAINLGVLNSRSALAKALDLTDSDIKQFKSLNSELERTNFLLMKGSSVQGLYQKYMDTSVGKVMQLKNAWQNFLNTVGQVALQIYAAVAPVLTRLINLATYAIQVLAKFFNIDLSTKGSGLASPVSNKAVDNLGRYADNVKKAGDATEEAGEKAKKASRKVAAFDDVIQINDDKSTAQKNKDAKDLVENLEDIQKYDPAEWVDSFNDAMAELDIPDFSFAELKDKLRELLDDFKNWEEAIDWDSLRNKAAEFGKELANILNIIVDDEQAWKDLGDLIGNSLNVLLEFLNAFAKNFHFEQFGKDLAVMFKEIFNQLDEDLAADTIYNWLTGALKTAIGFFEQKPITTAAASISSIFAKLINKLDSKDSLNTITRFINSFFNDVLGAINSALTTFELNDTISKIGDIIYHAFVALGNNTPKILETVSRLISTLLDAIGTSLSSAIDGFFDGLGNNDETLQRIIDSIIGVVNSLFNNLGKIGDAIAEHKDQIITLITKFINDVFENAGSWGLELQPLVDAIVEVLQSLDWNKIRGALSQFLENMHLNELIGEIINTMIQYGVTLLFIKLDETFNSINTYITGSFTTLGDSLTTLLTTLVGSLIAIVGSALGLSKEEIQSAIDSINTIFSDNLDFWEGIFKLGWDNITLIFREAWAIIKGGLTGDWGSITQPIQDIMDDIWKIIKSGINGFIDLINTFIERIDSIPNIEVGDVKLGFNIPKIPRLAIGGIVESSTLINAGEDGAEAILPLQKNTEWMDALASKLASQMNENGNAGGTVNIQMSNKNFYTRSEMLDFADQVVKALRVYGVNVSVAY